MAGHDGMCAMHDGAPFCWGPSAQSIIGVEPTEIDFPFAVPIQGLPTGTIRQLARSWSMACALIHDTSDKVYCWGNDSCMVGGGSSCDSLPVPADSAVAVAGLPDQVISEISIGGEHACALTLGEVYCWGNNTDGQLGIEGAPSHTAVKAPIPANALHVKAISNTSCAFYDRQPPYCWGATIDDLAFTAIPSTLNSVANIVDLNRRRGGLCALTQEGEVYCWTAGVPSKISLPTGPKVIALGDVLYSSETACLLREGGSVWCWGSNAEHQCGQPNLAEGGQNTYPPEQAQQIALPLPATEIAHFGETSICARLSDGDVVCWGSNYRNALGRRDEDQSFSSAAPKRVEGMNAMVLRNGQDASFVIGQTVLYDRAIGPEHFANAWTAGSIINDQLFLPDPNFNRIWSFNAVPNSTRATPDFLIGQADLLDGDGIGDPMGGDRQGYPFFEPVQIQKAPDGRYLVATYGDAVGNTPGIISTWDAVPEGRNAYQSNVLVTNLDGVEAMSIALGKLVVSMSNSIRIWNSVPGAPAVAEDADIIILRAGATGAALSSSYHHWTDGKKLLIADNQNHRVLGWNTFPTAPDSEPDFVLGQTALTCPGQDGDGNGGTCPWGTSSTQLYNPYNVTSNGTQIFVADTQNNRVLVWNSFPTTHGVAADIVLGQEAFFSGGTPLTACNRGGTIQRVDANTLCQPYGIFYGDHKLFVGDSENRRWVVFESGSTSDLSRPRVTLSNPVLGLPDAIQIQATFTEVVTGLDASDISVSGGATITDVNTSDNMTYILTLSTPGPGTYPVQIPSGAAQDAAGNLSEISNAVVATPSASAVTSFLGDALHFDGASDHIRVPNLDSDTLSVSFWINREDNNTEMIVSSDNYGGWVVYIEPTYGFTVGFGYLGATSLFSTTPIPTGEWHFVTVTLEANFVTFYLDGVQDGIPQAYPWANNSNGANYRIGDFIPFDSGNGFLKGSLDELVIWNKALTGGEISTLFNTGTGIQSYANFDDMVAGWHFNSLTGTLVPDFTGNGYDGTLEFSR